MKEVWDYNVKIAKQAVKMGFQEIQFDYVRFPEGFEKRDDELTYGHGDYGKTADSNVQKRVHAVTDFVGYAKKKLKPYGADVSVDIFVRLKIRFINAEIACPMARVNHG
jgi:hypothetical protein